MPEAREEPSYILWDIGQKKIPPRPENPADFPQEDVRHWYDYEYAGWGVEKVEIPESTGDGAQGKHIILLNGQVPHPYFVEFTAAMGGIARTYGIELKVQYAYWDSRQQSRQVDKAIAEAPDMIILVSGSVELSAEWYRKINAAGIPVIASNTMPDPESFRYIVAWTGPDDWGQMRMLANVFAERMGFEGGYCIVEHFPGTSPYYARTWGTITELQRTAPRMRLLDRRPADLGVDKAREATAEWIRRFGPELKGIVSADDCAQVGIAEVLEEAGREDVVCVACGNTRTGMEMLREGRLHAITYQSPELDGALSLQVAIDWFNGLQVEPIRYLPKHIITGEDVEDFLFGRHEIQDIDLDELYQLICDCNRKGMEAFFDNAYLSFVSAKVIPIESFRGFCIEVLSDLIRIVKSRNLKIEDIVGGYEALFKNLFNQKTLEKTLEWMKKISGEIIGGLCLARTHPKSPVQRVVEYVDQHYGQPLSLKTLSHRFNLSAAYLGRLFRQETGKNFPRYLNEVRIQKAKDLLRTSSLRANQIAREVGYTDPDYFYDIFKRYTGLSPTEFLQAEVEVGSGRKGA